MATAPILVIGAGSWGTALAIQLARNHHATVLWGRDATQMAALTAARVNARYLPQVPFPDLLTAEDDLEAALAACREVIVAVPTAALAGVLEAIAHLARNDVRLCLACKGFEIGSGLLPHQIAHRYFSGACPLAALSGPAFAKEVALGLPTAVAVASADAAFAQDLAGLFHGGHFRVYRSEDITGVELGGAVKNVLAIAAGISDGLGFGANARAAIITRGLAEIMRLGAVLGAKTETLMGLSGLGDLVLTCTQDLSRNRRLGLALAQGHPLAGALQQIGQAVEGVGTAEAVARLAGKHHLDMPISLQVAALLRGEITPQAAVTALLSRDAKAE